jgi:hypothetical protein
MKKIAIIIATILAVIILSGYGGRITNTLFPAKDYPDNIIPKPVFDQVQTPNPTPRINKNLLIDNISHDLEDFNKKGWNKLYDSNEFDCSHMTTFMWDYFRTNYKLLPKIIVAPDRSHAWLAVRVKDAGDTDRYLHWTIKGVDYYFIESTVPKVVIFEKDIHIGDNWYASTIDFYITRIFMADDPSEANTLTGRWSTEFRLTKSDIDKLNTFK